MWQPRSLLRSAKMLASGRCWRAEDVGERGWRLAAWPHREREAMREAMRLAVVVVRILTEQQHPDLLRRHQPQRVEDVLLWRKDGVRRALGGHECVQLGEI